jgi:salicylate biosynthesis isochorismate synthase/menaquinone-specific isochorismate synthase
MRWIVSTLPCDGVDPLALFGAARGQEGFLWSRASHAIATIGALHAIESCGAQRFADAANEVEGLLSAIDVAAGASIETQFPLLVGGFGFEAAPASDPNWAGFPALRFVLPGLALVQRDGAGTLVGVAEIAAQTSRAAAGAELRARLLRERERLLRQPGCELRDGVARGYRVEADRSPAQYRALVEAARDAVTSGSFEKLVVARSVRLASREPIDVVSLLGVLRRSYPSCTTFAVRRGDRSFVGASPERLVRVRGRQVDVAALAGSAPRGRSPEEDERLGTALRESKKEQEEHAAVVRALSAALAPICAGLDVPEAPRLLRVENIQHLETPIAGTLRGDANLFDLAGRVHPTPAVAGAPRDAALAWLAEREALVRGWYGGGVGYLDAAGGGELCAGLRSALVCGSEARLYAGAGIVAASDPEAELIETRLKLRALLVPLLEI